MPQTKHHHRELRPLLHVAGIALLLWLSGPPAMALDQVVLQLKWRHQFQFAGYYAAIAQGYYRDAGLEVTLKEAVPGIDPVHEVLRGEADFGVGTSNLILLRAQGQPLVVLAVIYQHSPFALLATAASGVRDIHDVAGTPIMMEPDAAELLAYFQNEGVNPAKLKILAHSFDALDLVRNKAGAMSAYSTDEPFHLKSAGIDYLIFSPRSGGIDFYGDNLYTTEDQIRRHPERVKAFLTASLRGWEYAMKHPEEMVDIILRDYPRGKTREQLLFEAEETAKLVHPELIELGYVNSGRWTDIARTYASLGMMPENFSLKGFIYERAPRLDLRWLFWTGCGILAVASAVGGWSLLTARMNQQLRREAQARREAEQVARSESAAKTHFLAVLAHEVRSPLSGILSALWLFKNAGSEAERREVVDIAEGSAANLLRMVDNILDHAKLETGKMMTEALPVQMAGFLEEIVQLFHAAAATESVTVRLQIAPGTPATITTDPTRLRQILSNLLSNAIKFTARGTVELSVRAEPPDGSPRQMIFDVADSGPGLTPEQISRIFEPYTQADASVTRHYGGTGLGLSISRELAALLGGGISVTSLPGHGATFSLSILDRSPLLPGPAQSFVSGAAHGDRTGDSVHP